MNTPICEFVEKYLSSNPVRLHMPGHKGKNFLGYEKYDITEITGADELFNPCTIIEQSENNATKLFGTQKTLYSAEGSSLAIRTMLYLVCLDKAKKGKKALIAAARNVHKSFVYSAAMLDFDVSWIYPENKENNLLSCNISPEYLEDFLTGSQQKPCAVYITSPDYLGNVQDIQGLSKVCKKHDILLLVDNAHGAYTKFLPRDIHPITLGADMCCDSAHKTLPVVTGGAYLHISKNMPFDFCDNAKNCMAAFASTSPSYLILQSLDNANKILDTTFSKDLEKCTSNVTQLKNKLCDIGYKIHSDEPLKLTIDARAYGYYGFDIAKHLERNNVFPEFSDKDFVVLMFSPYTKAQSFDTIYGVLSELQKKSPIAPRKPSLILSDCEMPIRQALMSPRRKINVQDALGKVLADACVSCPPAIPVAICGEKITKEHIDSFVYYGINEIFVVDNK